MRFGPAPGDRGRFAGAWSDLAGVGRDHLRGGYSRHAFDDAEMQLREWFTEQATRRHLDVETDRNGNLWAWWGEPAPGAVVTGSHLDSVPGGGAFDGPLGVVSALLAVDELGTEPAALSPEILHLVAARCSDGLCTILAGNVAAAQFTERYVRTDTRIASRLMSPLGTVVDLEGADLRVEDAP